ncbi:bifunctional histidinal dehydrogenase/ histidinol dehydrogenase [Fictibacillus macauensis ZFHKF-1]|uniref:Histidinol dehydrogenase n=1 Tax=Fictibacillus macauensis ZFHKF-1 TaxID=1196324 RepID=I8UJM3_9BACL|nr:histidinol dehydrogenase [Fictibacillus macauensis]EIT87013.1 bifunctional histidinal dehydrogenase/ histidinol dehydrogenase [Fictibacillus macauensis ZFHKF-1]
MKILRTGDALTVTRNLEDNIDSEREAVQRILASVKKEGDAALLEWTKTFDHVTLSSLQVSEQEIKEAYEAIDQKTITLIKEAAQNIETYHKNQVRASWFMTNEEGTLLGQKVTPLAAAGVYVPGGTAAYPSSVLMGVIPAKVAGVSRIVLTSPPMRNGKLTPAVIVAANECGVHEMYKVGGAQAIGALAYGTQSIAAVDKIVGPGNLYVALAKKEVFGTVGIDALAGPSEIAILADETANAAYVAADLLSQAEHDVRAAAVLVTTSETLAQEVKQHVALQLEQLPRRAIAAQALDTYGLIYVASSIEEGINIINELAPEHLEIMTRDPYQELASIKHAGAIFLGRYSSEPVGDYFAGSNHVLPTSGSARFSSGLSVDDFVKKSSVIAYSQQALKHHGEKIAAFARLEGLEAHARAVELRLEEQ